MLDDDGARVLAVHVAHLLAEIDRGDELIDSRMDQHAGCMDAGLVAEHVMPDSGLCRRHHDATDPLHVMRELAQFLVFEAGDLDPEQITQLEQHLVHGRVARSLTDPVHRGREDFGARAKSDYGVPGPDPEVVVGVDDERRLWRGGLDRGYVLANRKR